MLPLNTSRQISITGATGHLGSALVPMMLDQGYSLKCLYRNEKLSLIHENLTWVQGELEDKKAISELLEDTGVLIHCASLISIGEQDNKEVFSVNVEGAAKIADACAEKGIRLVYISSTAAADDTAAHETMDENTPWRTKGDFPYGLSKAKAEQLVLQAVAKSGLDALILRPSALIGPPDRRPSRFGASISDMHAGKVPMITSGGYNVMDVRDFAQTVINSITMGRKGEIYLTGGEFHSLREIAGIAGKGKVPLCLPVDLVIRMLPLIRLYDKLFPLRWPVTRESLVTLKRAPRNMDSSKAKRELQHRTRPMQESITDLLAWMKNSPK